MSSFKWDPVAVAMINYAAQPNEPMRGLAMSHALDSVACGNVDATSVRRSLDQWVTDSKLSLNTQQHDLIDLAYGKVVGFSDAKAGRVADVYKAIQAMGVLFKRVSGSPEDHA